MSGKEFEYEGMKTVGVTDLSILVVKKCLKFDTPRNLTKFTVWEERLTNVQTSNDMLHWFLM